LKVKKNKIGTVRICPELMKIATNLILAASADAFIFASRVKAGGLAQLARAFAWHAKGHRFDSGNLHRKSFLTLSTLV
jgi:predicted lysophospholipase L1 biosynthesis ABC-type transport system permease subunit